MYFRILGLVLALGALAQAGSTAAQAARAVVKCRTTTQTAVTDDRFHFTSSSSYIPIPGMALRLNQLKRGCVIVVLQVFASANGTALLRIDARLDDGANSYLSRARPELAASDQTWGVVRTIRFIWPNVPRGIHTVQLFYASSAGGTVNLHEPMMIVKYVR